MVVVISVNAYPFSAFSNLTYHLEDTRVVAFWLHCAVSVRTQNLEVVTTRLLPSLILLLDQLRLTQGDEPCW